MKGFKLSQDGDLQLTNGIIDTVSDEYLTAQTVRTVSGTNKGEWFMDENEGINFRYVFGKGITEDMIRSQFESALRQVDDTFYFETFDLEIDNINRKALIKYVAKNKKGETIKGEHLYD